VAVRIAKKALAWSAEEMRHLHARDVAPMQGQVVHDVQEMQKDVSDGLRSLQFQ